MNDDAFLDYETQRLNTLQKTFSPEDQNKYGEEVAYINYLLKLLKEENKKPDTKSTEKEKDKTKSKIQENIKKLVSNFSLKRATDTTHDQLPPEAIEKAKLVEVSSKYYRNNGMDSENYVKQVGLDPAWKIDEELSDGGGVVALNEDTGKVVVAFRGTDKTNLNDLDADARIYMGSEQTHNHFSSSREQLGNAINKYGKANVETAGYSLGSMKGLSASLAYDVPHTGFNSFIGKTIVNRPDIFTGTKHTLWRTQDDLPSLQTAYLQGKSNIDVNVVSTRGGNMNALNPYQTHKLENFLSNEGRGKLAVGEGLQGKIEGLTNHALKHGELDTLHKMRTLNSNVKDIDTRPPPTRSKFQEDLDTRVRNLPDLHLPKVPIPKELAEGLPTHNEEGIPVEDISVGVNPLASKSFKGKSIRPTLPVAEDISVGVNPLSLSNKNISIEPSYSQRVPRNAFVEPLTIDLGADTGNPELDDLLRFTQKQLVKKNPVVKSKPFKGLEAKQKATIKGLRSKTKLEPTPEGRKLDNQMDRLENRLGVPDTPQPIKGTGGLFPPQFKKPKDTIPTAEVITEPPTTQSKSFTEFAVGNKLDVRSNYQKSLWVKSGGELMDFEKEGFNPVETFNTDDTVNSFVNDSANERLNTLKEHANQQSAMEGELNALDNSGVRSGSSYAMDIARGIHPSNLALGLAGSIASDKLWDRYGDKVLGEQSDLTRTAEKGATAGALTSTLLGTALLPEAVAGSAGYVATKYTTEGIASGLKSLGANQDTQDSLSDIGGGIVGGGTAGFLGALTAGAMAGGEAGGVAGLGVASAETALIGAGIGAVIGAGAYGIGKIFG